MKLIGHSDAWYQLFSWVIELENNTFTYFAIIFKKMTTEMLRRLVPLQPSKGCHDKKEVGAKKSFLHSLLCSNYFTGDCYMIKVFAFMMNWKYPLNQMF